MYRVPFSSTPIECRALLPKKRLTVTAVTLTNHGSLLLRSRMFSLKDWNESIFWWVQGLQREQKHSCLVRQLIYIAQCCLHWLVVILQGFRQESPVLSWRYQGLKLGPSACKTCAVPHGTMSHSQIAPCQTDWECEWSVWKVSMVCSHDQTPAWKRSPLR